MRLAVPNADWRVLLFLLFGAIVSTAFFGLTPALQATRIEPVRTIRGEVARDTRPGRARRFLIGLQVSASALLLICAAVFLRSTFTAANESPGVRISDIVVVRVSSEDARRDDPGGERRAVGGGGGRIVAGPAHHGSTGRRRDRQRQDDAGVPVRVAGVFGLLGIEVLQGRGFMADERSSNLSVAVVSERPARLWPQARPSVR